MADRLVAHGGQLTVAGGEERYILIPARAYAAIIDAMRSLVGNMAAGPLYYLGKKIGRGLVEEMERLLAGRSSLEDVVREYARYLGQLGSGRVEVLELRGDYAKLRLVNPPSMVGGVARSIGGNGSSGVCHLERGMLAAVLRHDRGAARGPRGGPRRGAGALLPGRGRPYPRGQGRGGPGGHLRLGRRVLGVYVLRRRRFLLPLRVGAWHEVPCRVARLHPAQGLLQGRRRLCCLLPVEAQGGLQGSCA